MPTGSVLELNKYTSVIRLRFCFGLPSAGLFGSLLCYDLLVTLGKLCLVNSITSTKDKNKQIK